MKCISRTRKRNVCVEIENPLLLLERPSSTPQVKPFFSDRNYPLLSFCTRISSPLPLLRPERPCYIHLVHGTALHYPPWDRNCLSALSLRPERPISSFLVTAMILLYSTPNRSVPPPLVLRLERHCFPR